MDDYEVTRKIGRGKYSEVFDANHLEKDSKKTRCVVKVCCHCPSSLLSCTMWDWGSCPYILNIHPIRSFSLSLGFETRQEA